jgi:hypothetical protein
VTATALAQALYVDEPAVRELVAQLDAAGLIAACATPDTWRFAAADDALAHEVERVAKCYKQHMVELTRLIHA